MKLLLIAEINKNKKIQSKTKSFIWSDRVLSFAEAMAAKIDNAKFDSVPIIEVTKENVSIVGPLIRGAIIGADFIAIDCVSFCMEM